MHKILRVIEEEVNSRPSAIEFEIAYQARVAIDRIRFAIKQTVQFAPRTDAMRDAGLELLDAVERLETADRRFQQRSRLRDAARFDTLADHHSSMNSKVGKPSPQRPTGS
jgi:hypothetical protein